MNKMYQHTQHGVRYLKQGIVALLLLIVAPFSISTSIVVAQSTKTVEATYTYVASQNESPEQAKERAINLAKIKALKDKFGTIVSDASASVEVQDGDKSYSKFVSMSSEGELNGEWVGDLAAPKVEMSLVDGKIVFTATVKGTAMEIASNKIDFVAKVLRNIPSIDNESSEFVAGNGLYVSFTSPVSGYLAIYLLDSDNAYCLLPYMRNQDGFFKVNAGTEYMLFSRNKHSADEDPAEIDEYTVESDGDATDFNQIYFIFSPNKFRKAVDKHRQLSDGTLFPRELTYEEFQKWIIRLRRVDKEVAVQVRNIQVMPIR